MKNFIKSRSVEIAIIFGAFIFCSLFFKIIDDDEIGSFAQGVAGGQFCNFSFIDYCFLSLVWVNVTYKYLYHILPAYNWMGIGFLFFEYVSFYLFLRTVRKVILSKGYSPNFIVLFQLLAAFFFIENIFTVNHTRFALIFCGTSLINLVFTDNIRKRDVVINVLVFVLGMLHRPESSLGMLLLVPVGYLIYRFDIIFLIKRIFFPGAITVLFLGFIAYDWVHTDVYVKKIEPEIEYKLMDNQVIPLAEMHSAVDSIKYQLGTQAMWFDPRVLTPDFLRSILQPGFNRSGSHARAVLYHVASFYKYYLFIPAIFLILFSFSLLEPELRKTGLKILLFQSFTFTVIYYLDFNGQLVANRHFLNLELISLLILFYYVFGNGWPFVSAGQYKALMTLCSLTLVISLCYTFNNYRDNNHTVVMDVAEKERLMNALENKYSGQTVVVTLGAIHCFDHTFSIKTKNYTKNDYILYDIFTFQLLPVYIDYMNRICDCDALDPVAFFNWLAKNNALYMSEPRRYDLTAKYMLTIHSDSVEFVSPVNLNRLSGVNNFATRDCEIRKVTVR